MRVGNKYFVSHRCTLIGPQPVAVAGVLGNTVSLIRGIRRLTECTKSIGGKIVKRARSSLLLYEDR